MNIYWIHLSHTTYVTLLCKALLYEQRNLSEFGVQILSRQEVEYNDYMRKIDIPQHIKNEFLSLQPSNKVLCRVFDPGKFIFMKLKYSINA